MSQKSTGLLAIVIITLFLMEACPISYAMPPEGVIDVEEADALFDSYVSEQGLNPEMISVAYVYTETGESWYHLEDKWYYSASLYKVPLMMLLAEKESNGELACDTVINGMTVENIEEEVLVYSNNPVAYSTLLYFAQPDVCRKMFCRYSELPESYYTWDFYGGSYFTARFMSDVMCSLYRDPERFPRIIEYMKRAQPDHFFKLSLGDRFEIAQKYGTYSEEDGTDWNHTTGIVFTPHPFVLTVMTKYGGISETVISDLAALFCDITLKAEAKLSETEPSVEQDIFNESRLMPKDLTETVVPELEAFSESSGTEGKPTLQPVEKVENKEEVQSVRPLIISSGMVLEIILIVLLMSRYRKKHHFRSFKKE